jgi:CheY-like chemotaxis protein
LIAAKRTIPKVNWKGKNILIAEDEYHNYIYLRETLKRTGVSYLRALDGHQAVDLVLNSEHNFDLVLMDIKMPEMNGYEATRIIKSKKPKLPVVAQTAHAMLNAREKSLEAGCDEYISKPYEPVDLVNLLAQFLGH